MPPPILLNHGLTSPSRSASSSRLRLRSGERASSVRLSARARLFSSFGATGGASELEDRVSAESPKLRTLGVRGSLGAGEAGLGCARKRPGRYADSSVHAWTTSGEQVRGTCSTRLAARHTVPVSGMVSAFTEARKHPATVVYSKPEQEGEAVIQCMGERAGLPRLECRRPYQECTNAEQAIRLVCSGLPSPESRDELETSGVVVARRKRSFTRGYLESGELVSRLDERDKRCAPERQTAHKEGMLTERRRRGNLRSRRRSASWLGPPTVQSPHEGGASR